jgi:TolB protein
MFRFTLIAALLAGAVAPAQQPASLGLFESQTDIGEVLHPGSTEYDAVAKTYTVSGSGENMWSTGDDFHFVWKKISSSDVTLTATLEIVGAGGAGHRKGVLMIRQSLDKDSAYVDAARHGDGLTSLQFRDRKGAITREVESNTSGPSRLRLEKQGDRFYMWIASADEPMQFSGGAARVEMQGPFYVGIGVCAHQKDAVEKVVFSGVDLETRVKHPRTTYSTVETVLLSGDARSGYVSSKLLTAPGWSPDGHSLTYDLDGQGHEVPFTPLKTAAPVGPPATASTENKFVYFAAPQSGTQQIWRKAPDGTQSEPITTGQFNNSSPILSPDGKYLLFLSSATGNPDTLLRIMSLADNSVKTLAAFTAGPGSLGPAPWSPDGRRVTFISYQAMD